MGGNISKMMNKIFGLKEMRLLMLGLDAAGKTSARTPLFSPQQHPMSHIDALGRPLIFLLEYLVLI